MIASSSLKHYPLRRALLAGLCGSALLMGACSNDKAPAEEITVSAETLELSRADEDALSRHFEIEARGGTEAETLALLTAFGIEEAMYGERVIEGSTVTYSDWTITNDEGTVTAETVTLTGLHGTDDGPTVDKLTVEGMTAVSAERDEDDVDDSQVNATLESLVVVKPSAAMMADMIDVLTAQEDGSDAVDGIASDPEFRAMQLVGFSADITDFEADGTMSVQQVVIGNDDENDQFDAVIESVSLVMDNRLDDNQDITLTMDGLTLIGLDTSAADDPEVGSGVMATLMQMGTMVSPTGVPPYRQIDMGKLNLTHAMVDLDMEGFEADSSVRGDVTTFRSVFSPMTLTFKNFDDTPAAAYMDALRENGLAEITMRGSSVTEFDQSEDRVTVKDSQFDIDEGLRTDCGYALTGMTARNDYLREAGMLVMPSMDTDAEDQDAAFEAYFEELEAYNEAQMEANGLINLETFSCDIQDVPDNSLVERGYNVASAITGRPVAVLKGGAKTMIAMGSMMASSEIERDLMDTVGSAMIDFIDTPGQTLSISMQPAQPVSINTLTELQAGTMSLDDLGLTVEVKGPVE